MAETIVESAAAAVAAAAEPDGKTTPNGSAAATTRILPLTCSGHTRPVTHLHFSHLQEDGNYYLISACKDGKPMLRDGKTGDWIGTFLGHKGAVWNARLAENGATAITSSADFTAKIWNAETGQTIQTLEHNHIVRSGDLSSLKAVTGGAEKKLRLWDLESAQADVLHETESTIKCVLLDKSNRMDGLVMCGGDDKMVQWIDPRSKTVVKQFDTDGIVSSMEQSFDRSITVVTAGKSVYFFDAASMTLDKALTMTYDVSSVSINANRSKFVAAGSDPWVRIYQYDTEQEIELYKAHHGPLWSTSYSPDSKLYATASEDGTIRLWKVNDSEPYGLWP